MYDDINDAPSGKIHFNSCYKEDKELWRARNADVLMNNFYEIKKIVYVNGMNYQRTTNLDEPGCTPSRDCSTKINHN